MNRTLSIHLKAQGLLLYILRVIVANFKMKGCEICSSFLNRTKSPIRNYMLIFVT